MALIGCINERVISRQYFCGYAYFQFKTSCHPSSLTRWRQRVGQEDLNKTVVRPKELTKVIADTTVMEKNIRFPTDVSLRNKA